MACSGAALVHFDGVCLMHGLLSYYRDAFCAGCGEITWSNQHCSTVFPFWIYIHLLKLVHYFVNRGINVKIFGQLVRLAVKNWLYFADKYLHRQCLFIAPSSYFQYLLDILIQLLNQILIV